MKNKVLKGLLLSVLSLIAGYFAISLPFNLFGTLSSSAMHIVFITELAIYFAIGMIFLVAFEKSKEKKVKAEQRHIQRKKKIESVYNDWYNIAA